MPSRKRIFDIIQIGQDSDWPSRGFDFTVMAMILINLFIALFETYDISQAYLPVLNAVETITVLFFTVEYALRLWTADFLHPKVSRGRASLLYIFSLGGIVDLLSFLPWYLPVFFPAGVVAFRMFRVIRILRLFRVNAYSDALTVITDVIKSKRDQLASSVFVILILMLASSLCMYSLEHDAQPEVFRNAFSGLWWSVSTLLTVGYGDIYPVTNAGRFFAIIISFLGVGMVAIPTGILSAGFVEQYSRMKSLNECASDTDLRFIRLNIEPGHPWEGRSISDISLPHDLILAVVQRGDDLLPPTSDLTILADDNLILGAEDYQENQDMLLREITLRPKHEWIGEKIFDLDISRRTMIVMVRRGREVLMPKDELVLEEGDVVITYTRKRKAGAM